MYIWGTRRFIYIKNRSAIWKVRWLELAVQLAPNFIIGGKVTWLVSEEKSRH